MRKFICTTEVEPLAMGILQIAPSLGFEALRYSDLTYIKILIGFFSERFTMSPPIPRNCALRDLKLTLECLFTLTSRIGYIETSAPYYLFFSFHI